MRSAFCVVCESVQTRSDDKADHLPNASWDAMKNGATLAGPAVNETQLRRFPEAPSTRALWQFGTARPELQVACRV
jgi:hypothetical protein